MFNVIRYKNRTVQVAEGIKKRFAWICEALFLIALRNKNAGIPRLA